MIVSVYVRKWVFILSVLPLVLVGAEKAEKRCVSPKAGPAWFEDFTPLQKKGMDVEWSATDKTGTYSIDGSYMDPAPKGVPFSSYSNETSLELTENWKCGKSQSSDFVSLSGKMKNELEWEKETPTNEEEFESEDKYNILAIDRIHHVSHQSERSIEEKTQHSKKEFEEETKWKQKWDKENVPTITGRYESESEEEFVLPAKLPRKLASMRVMIPGLEQSPLPPGRRLTVVTKKEGKFNGPSEPSLMETEKTAIQWNGDQQVEEKKISLKEVRYYLFDPQKKVYELLSHSETYSEDRTHLEKGLKQKVHKTETWTDINSPPSSSSYWKHSYERTEKSRSSLFSVSSIGHGLLSPLYGIRAKNGTYTRTTDYYPNGQISRFMLFYFPPNQKENQTIIDLQFSSKGELSSLVVDDGTDYMERFPEPFGNIGALTVLQRKINSLIKFEKLSFQKKLPKREVDLEDYPTVVGKS